jgi:hypothetical protein
MKENESIPQEVKSRRKLLAGIGVLSLFSILKAGIFTKKPPVISCAPPLEKKETIKVLAQDGRLVEVDVSRIKQLKAKISDQELLGWIKKQ